MYTSPNFLIALLPGPWPTYSHSANKRNSQILIFQPIILIFGIKIGHKLYIYTYQKCFQKCTVSKKKAAQLLLINSKLLRPCSSPVALGLEHKKIFLL